MNPTYSIRQGKNGMFFFFLVTHNGQIMMQSEQYTTKKAALSGVEWVKKYAGEATIEDKT